MSGLKHLFGGKKASANNTKDALRQLEETQDLLTKKSEFLEKKIDDEIATARKHVALQALSRKKVYENQLQKIDNTLLIIANQMQSLEDAGMNLEVIKTLKATSKSMKAAQNNMKIDDVHEIMDEIAEQRDIAQEISSAISDPAAFGIDVDNDELLKELEELNAEEFEAEILNVEDLPSVPSKELPEPSTLKQTKDTSDKDLEELLAWTE